MNNDPAAESPVPFGVGLDLRSESSVAQYWFHAGGAVSATLGSRGGAVCAPILKFNILGPKSIEIHGPGGIVTVWENIRAVGRELHVECSGANLVFEIGRGA
jgi:hypothetical protein